MNNVENDSFPLNFHMSYFESIVLYPWSRKTKGDNKVMGKLYRFPKFKKIFFSIICSYMTLSCQGYLEKCSPKIWSWDTVAHVVQIIVFVIRYIVHMCIPLLLVPPLQPLTPCWGCAYALPTSFTSVSKQKKKEEATMVAKATSAHLLAFYSMSGGD